MTDFRIAINGLFCIQVFVTDCGYTYSCAEEAYCMQTEKSVRSICQKNAFHVLSI